MWKLKEYIFNKILIIRLLSVNRVSFTQNYFEIRLKYINQKENE
jgi:hypothetical protein